jgi:hypothetical protein
MGLLRNRSQAQKTRRVELAVQFGSRYELRDPRYFIDIANPLRTVAAATALRARGDPLPVALPDRSAPALHDDVRRFD